MKVAEIAASLLRPSAEDAERAVDAVAALVPPGYTGLDDAFGVAAPEGATGGVAGIAPAALSGSSEGRCWSDTSSVPPADASAHAESEPSPADPVHALSIGAPESDHDRRLERLAAVRRELIAAALLELAAGAVIVSPVAVDRAAGEAAQLLAMLNPDADATDLDLVIADAARSDLERWLDAAPVLAHLVDSPPAPSSSASPSADGSADLLERARSSHGATS